MCNTLKKEVSSQSNFIKELDMNHIRRISVVLIILLAASPSFARQEHKLKKKDVPKAVLESFEKSYPGAKAKEFSTESENGKTTYEIESVDGKVSRDVSYDAAGNVVSVEETISPASLPDPVSAALKKDYPKCKVLKCEKVSEGSALSYELLVQVGKKKTEVVYSPEGKVLETERK